jgi:lysophospholipase L1-like esterase
VLSSEVVRAARTTSLLAVSALVAACGGGKGPPTGPGSGTPVAGFVFYDENANGVAEPGETMRLPGVTVSLGGSTAQTSAGGRVTVNDVPAGSQAASLQASTLPAYFTAGASVPVTVPQAAGAEVGVPATLAVGPNRPRLYMAFGDSISAGEGSSDGSGYRRTLETTLAGYWGSSHQVADEGASGSRSGTGASRIGSSLARVRPAYTLVLYGTNDWNDCRGEVPCSTIDNLRSMVRQARDAQSFAVLGTIPPVNPAFADKSPTERNDWVKRMNDQVRAMAQQERVPVADIYDAFVKRGNLPGLFSDFLHPNDTGYALMAQVWSRAITLPLGAATSGRASFFVPPSGF